MLAIGSPKRLPDYPDLPTVAEGGLPDFEAKSWFGLFATGGTPAPIVAKINADVRKIIESPDFATTFLSKQMMQSITSTPEAYAELIRTNSRLWAKVIAAANLKID